MAFENKTIEDVNDLIISGLETELNTKFRLLPKSFVSVLAKVLASVYITLYRQQAWIFLQLFVETATFDEIEVLGKKIRPLVQWGELVGIGQPDEATQFEGKIKVTVTSIRTYLEQGTQFVNPATQKIYIVTESKLLTNQYETISVKCSEAGTSGNLEVDDELQTVSPLSNIERTAICTEMTVEAVDAESETSYRSRVKARWQVQPQGGSLADYRNWASDVSGVLQTYIYKDDDSASGVLIYVVADNDTRIASSALLKAVGYACTYDSDTGEANRKPLTAVIDPANDESYSNIRACTITEFDVYIIGYDETELSSFKTSAKSNIEEYFLGREPYVRGLSVDSERTDRISQINLTGICNDIAESLTAHFDNVVLKKDDIEIDSYTLGKGELSKLGKLFVNGVEV